MKVCVVGAGIAGLGAGRALVKGGHEVVVFEKSKAIGGRIATRRVDGFTFDTGTQSFAPYDAELSRVITEELVTDELVRIAKPIYVHESLRVSPGDPRKNATARYTYISGNTKLPKLMGAGLDIRFERSVEEIEPLPNDRFRVGDEIFDAVVLTMPIPQASLLLWSLGERRAIAPSRYRACLAVLLAYERPTPYVHYHALLNTEGSHPLQWLSLENVKSPGRALEGNTAMVAQMSVSFTHSAWDWPDERIVESVAGYIARLYGPEWSHPELSSVKKWKYSQPESIAMFDSVNRPGDRLVVAGDGLAGGRTEYAYASGLRAARHLMEQS